MSKESPGPMYKPDVSATRRRVSACSMAMRTMPSYFECVMAAASQAAPGHIYNPERIDRRGSAMWGSEPRTVFGK
eukprot:356188-Chlamydomonas_euryale.AAC.7